jgi:thiol-disulfide isomerase/thioredoxin
MALYEYFGDTCPHCITMKPLVEEVEKELGIKVEKLEVWNDEANLAKMEEVDKGRCGGVPFFYNSDTDDFICGSSSKAKLVAWAQGKK